MQRKKCLKMSRRGIAMVAALIFIMVFMAMSVGMMSMSSHNAIAASNLQTVNMARSTAESGLEVVRYWMTQVPASPSASNLYSNTLDALEDILSDADIVYARSENALHIGPVSLNNQNANRQFEAWISEDFTDADMKITVNGVFESENNARFSRAIQIAYGRNEIFDSEAITPPETKPYYWFDFGVASRGPLSLKSLEISAIEEQDGLDVKVGADAYIESAFTNAALNIQNAQISGNVKIVNPDADISWSGGQSSIGGEKDKDFAIANYVEVGVEPVKFPTPNPGHFDQYATGITIDSSNIGSYSTNVTLDNVRIAAGTNPKFTGNVTVRGVMYIEQPNVVEFAGNANIIGVIVGDGDITDNSGTNQVNFTGTVNSTSVKDLPADSQFDGIRDETGTFLMAPGFSVSFGGNFGTLNGCIVANGVKTYGNAGGTIAGSILNFSDDPMMLEGKDLLFRKSGVANLPPETHFQDEDGNAEINKSTWTLKYEGSLYRELCPEDMTALIGNM